MAKNYDAIVIGSGLGGLTAGALAAKEGARVLLLERHLVFGGCATMFTRKKLSVEVGLHEIDGLDDGDIKMGLFKELDIFSNIEFVPVPEFYAIRHHAMGEEPFVMPEGTEAALAATTKCFPQHKDALITWFDTLDTIRKKLLILTENQYKPLWWLLNGPIFPLRFWSIVRHDRTRLGDFLQQLFGDDDGVKLALCANLGYYSDSPDMSLLFFAAAQASYHKGGGHFIRGGSQKLSDYLVSIIENAGGTTRIRRTVTDIVVENGKAVGVRHVNHRGKDVVEDRASVLFGNAAPSVLADMLPSTHREAFRKDYADKPIATSLFSVYLGLDQSPSELGMDYYSTFIFQDWMKSLNSLQESGELFSEKPGDRIPLYTAVNYDKLGNHGLPNENRSLIVLCGVDYLKNWESLSRAEYKAHKAAWLDALIENLCETYPRLRGHIDYKEMATARTMKRYLNTPGGTAYGFAQDPMTAGRHRPAPKTRIPGLYLASAFTQPGGGFTGAMLGGENAYHTALKAQRAALQVRAAQVPEVGALEQVK